MSTTEMQALHMYELEEGDGDIECGPFCHMPQQGAFNLGAA